MAGTVALMLQANPGLTPPLIKAMLQYSAQPIPGANLLQQGAGLLNVERRGATRPRRCALDREERRSRPARIASGATLLSGRSKLMPAKTSTSLNGAALQLERASPTPVATTVVSGDALFTKLPADVRPRAWSWANGR